VVSEREKQSISETPAVYAAVRHCRRAIPRLPGDHRLSDDKQAGGRGCALQRQTYDLVGSMMPAFIMST
jgi:hypothetical protein